MLQISQVETYYGETQVLFGTTMAVGAGERVALLGRNGVGKTTLLKTIIGLLRPRRGEIRLENRRISGQPPYAIAAQGVGYVPQGRGIFPELTVAENLRMGLMSKPPAQRQVPEEIFTYFPILKERLPQKGGTMSGGQQQMLAIARALVSQPRLLILDEPSEGIQPSIVHEIGETLKAINEERGLTILIVEQNLELALAVGQRCLIMEKGRIVHQATPTEVRKDPHILQYLAI